MHGKWVFAAISGALGVLSALSFHWLVLLCTAIAAIRLLFIQARPAQFAACLAFLGMFILSGWAESSRMTILPEGSFSGTVQLLDGPVIDGDRLRSEILVQGKEKAVLFYKISSEMEKEGIQTTIKAGTLCDISGTLVKPNTRTNEHAFDYRRHLFVRNIHWTLQASSLESCRAPTFSVPFFIKQMRAKGIAKLDDQLPESATPYAQALLFGERTKMDPGTSEAYQRLGIVHLLAISGLHVGASAGALYLILLRIGMPRETTYWIMAVALPIYALISGANPPVLRAASMALLLLTARRFNIRLTSLDAISISFLLFLLFDPYLIFHIGFQLSFAVSSAIILSAPHILSAARHAISKLFATSFVSVVSSAPILVFHFHEISVISLGANMLFIPFYTVILLPAVFAAAFLIAIGSGLISLISRLLSDAVAISEKAAEMISASNVAVLVTGKPGIAATAALILAALAFFLLREQQIPYHFSVLPFCLVILLIPAAKIWSSEGEVVFLDVGQGDSTFIRLPYNSGVYVIDTGGQPFLPKKDWQRKRREFDSGRDILVPFLKSKAVTRIDKLFLTHSDADHIGGTEELLDAVKVSEIYISPNSWEKPMMERIVRKAEAAGIPIYEAKAGLSWETRYGSFQIVHPSDELYEGNNDSIVVYAEIGGLKWLFTGDLEAEGEAELLADYAPFSVDVLKAGHHGSRTSTTPEFLKALKPSAAVISAGRNNRYGHPHPQVVELLEEAGAAIYRTDMDGGIHYRFTRGGGTFRTVLP